MNLLMFLGGLILLVNGAYRAAVTPNRSSLTWPAGVDADPDARPRSRGGDRAADTDSGQHMDAAPGFNLKGLLQ